MLDTENSKIRFAALREADTLSGLDMKKLMDYQRHLINEGNEGNKAIIRPILKSVAMCVHCHYIFTPKSSQRHICDDCQTFIGRVIKRIKIRFGR